MVFNSIKDFRNRATEQDYEEMEQYILNQAKRTEAFPSEKYNFSYSAASQELRKKGYLTIPEESEESSELKITITKEEFTKEHITNRTFVVQKSLLERLDRMAEDNWIYNKKIIFNQLLSDALDEYGY